MQIRHEPVKHILNIFTFHFLLISSSQLFGQQISSQILDAETREPVSFATVFISNTSIGTVSDSLGYFTLQIRGLDQVELVISHLGYHLKSVRIGGEKSLGAIVLLNPKQTKIETVQIQAGHSPKRKKWLRKFEKAFLGTSKNRKRTQLLNPEVLIFEEKEGVLTAESLDYLEIRNEATAYNLKFYLNSFSLASGPSKDVAYTGKVFFENLDTIASQSSTISKARARTYLRSKKRFFCSLKRGSIKAKKVPNRSCPNQ